MTDGHADPSFPHPSRHVWTTPFHRPGASSNDLGAISGADAGVPFFAAVSVVGVVVFVFTWGGVGVAASSLSIAQQHDEPRQHDPSLVNFKIIYRRIGDHIGLKPAFYCVSGAAAFASCSFALRTHTHQQIISEHCQIRERKQYALVVCSQDRKHWQRASLKKLRGRK